MKKFNVIYSIEVEYEETIKAETEEEIKAKLEERYGKEIKIFEITEIKKQGGDYGKPKLV